MQLSRYSDLIVFRSTPDAAGVLCVDTQNCEGVLFSAIPCSTLNSTTMMILSYGNTTDTLVACDTDFAHASTAAGGWWVETDVYKPAARYIMATVSHTTSVPHWITARKYGLRAPLTGGYSDTGVNMPIDAEGVLRVISPTSTT
jgi:hypothetical protein